MKIDKEVQLLVAFGILIFLVCIGIGGCAHLAGFNMQ